jgi:hypothetical protein
VTVLNRRALELGRLLDEASDPGSVAPHGSGSWTRTSRR